jgi:hypothetical protein
MEQESNTHFIELKDIEYLCEEKVWLINFPPIVLKNLYESYIHICMNGEFESIQSNTPEGQELAFNCEYEDVNYIIGLKTLQHGYFIAIFGSFCETAWDSSYITSEEIT